MKVAAQIEMLVKQKEKIGEKNFDLDAWKTTATTLIANIFGKNDLRIETIQSLKIDYGSWALRDASASYDPVATCKSIASDVMDMSINELSAEGDKSIAIDVLENHLTGKQLKEVLAIIDKNDRNKLKTDLSKKLESFKAPLLAQVLAEIINNR